MEEIRIQTRIKEEIDKLMVMASGYIEAEVGVHTIEKGLFKQLLSIGLALLSYILEEKIKRLSGIGVPQTGGKSVRSKGIESRQYLSLFGLLELERPSYWDKELGKVHPVDDQLWLPKSSYWSYNIQEMVGESSSENDFKESVRLMNKLLDLGLSGKSSERNAGHLGSLVEAFYSSKDVAQQPDLVCFGASFDGKGIPKIKSKSEHQLEGNPKKRLGKGEKKGVMEMATVCVTSSFTPKDRSVDRIVRSLMGCALPKVKSEKVVSKSDKTQDNRWHKTIHRRAFLADQQKAVEYGLNRIKASMANPQSRFVVPIDAGIGLEDKVLAWVKENKMENQFDGILLDIIHVSEYVWDAATAIFGEKSRCRSPWVEEMLTDLLNSKVTKVISDLEQINSKSKLCEGKQRQVEKTITYFTNHQHKMDYKTFIEKGYPISSALVEAACGHLVKERMEQSGMRWFSTGAQNIMDLRAVKINGDMEEFMAFRILNDQKTKTKKAA
ncbi:MAG: ISKra4 family transposase [Saprospiraceae bacterium]|nr:ISKra4 family transposase [Saprospiraceae bacterium]